MFLIGFFNGSKEPMFLLMELSKYHIATFALHVNIEVMTQHRNVDVSLLP